LGRAVSYARLSGLVSLGLLEHARIFHGAPGVYLATRIGLLATDVQLPAARVDLRTYDHDLELTSLVVELEQEFGTERVRTERELRAADTPAEQGGGFRPCCIPLCAARSGATRRPAARWPRAPCARRR
jgi:hypothetical protein